MFEFSSHRRLATGFCAVLATAAFAPITAAAQSASPAVSAPCPTPATAAAEQPKKKKKGFGLGGLMSAARAVGVDSMLGSGTLASSTSGKVATMAAGTAISAASGDSSRVGANTSIAAQHVLGSGHQGAHVAGVTASKAVDAAKAKQADGGAQQVAAADAQQVATNCVVAPAAAPAATGSSAAPF